MNKDKRLGRASIETKRQQSCLLRKMDAQTLMALVSTLRWFFEALESLLSHHKNKFVLERLCRGRNGTPSNKLNTLSVAEKSNNSQGAVVVSKVFIVVSLFSTLSFQLLLIIEAKQYIYIHIIYTLGDTKNLKRLWSFASWIFSRFVIKMFQPISLFLNTLLKKSLLNLDKICVEIIILKIRKFNFINEFLIKQERFVPNVLVFIYKLHLVKY